MEYVLAGLLGGAALLIGTFMQMRSAQTATKANQKRQADQRARFLSQAAGEQSPAPPKRKTIRPPGFGRR